MNRSLHLLKIIGLVGMAFAVTPPIANAVLVAPHAVFIDDTQRTGQITVANPGDRPEEIEIEFKFGYPVTGPDGNPYVALIEQPGPDDPSAAAWISAYPRRLRLEPGQRQVVRLLATPPGDLPDGEHWSRMIVTSRRETPVASADSGLYAGISLELRTIMSVTYRKGSPTTGVVLTELNEAVEGDSLVTWIGLERQGNAAYLGSLHFDVIDSGDNVVREWSVPVAVYRQLRRRLALPLHGLPSGAYHVRFVLSTERQDIPQRYVLPAVPVTRSFRIEVN